MNKAHEITLTEPETEEVMDLITNRARQYDPNV